MIWSQKLRFCKSHALSRTPTLQSLPRGLYGADRGCSRAPLTSASSESEALSAYTPLFALQRTYDEIQTYPWRFPLHVRRLQSLAEAERARRQTVIDQSPLGIGRDTLFVARKEIYAILSRDDA